MTTKRILYGDVGWLREAALPNLVPRSSRPMRIAADADQLSQGLGRLVLAILEVVRQLLERQSVRRMESGSLSEEEVERLGRALQLLAQQLRELQDVFAVSDADMRPVLAQIGDLVGRGDAATVSRRR
jgi:hypothetical protein